MNTFTTWFRGDSEYYYKGICSSVENLKKGEFSLANFGIAGHMCYGYSLFVFPGQLLIPYHGIGIRLANLLMAVVTIGTFWKLLGVLFPKLEQWTRLFLTAAFTFSPFLLGIFSEVHSDFPVLCFFIWLVYSYVTGRQTACLVTGFLLCFSKEIGVLYYCSFFAGCFIYRLVKCEEKNWLKKLVNEFSALEWMLLIPADLFLISAYFSKSWGGSAITPELTDGIINTFHLSWDYIGIKLREIFLMNFAWLLIVPAVLFMIAWCRKKVVPLGVNKEWMIGIGVSTFTFFLFNCTYFTYTHYRYLQIYLFFYLIGVVLLLEKSCRWLWLKRGFCMILALAFLVESFVTIDPVTCQAFRRIDVGNGKLVSTSEFVTSFEDGTKFVKGSEDGGTDKSQLLDAVVYNREYLGFERVFEEALADIQYDETKLLIFPEMFEQNVSYTFLSYFGTHDVGELRWDKEKRELVLEDRGIPFWGTGISKKIPEYISAFPEVWYVELPYDGEYQEKNLKYFDIAETRTYRSGKWEIKLRRVQYHG